MIFPAFTLHLQGILHGYVSHNQMVFMISSWTAPIGPSGCGAGLRVAAEEAAPLRARCPVRNGEVLGMAITRHY